MSEPSTSGPWPGIVLLHEIWGLDSEMRAHADRLASHGFLTVAPDLYGSRRTPWSMWSFMRSVDRGVGRPFGDTETARRWLMAHPNWSGRIGVVGFSLGASLALSGATDGFDACASNYGEPPRSPEQLRNACPTVASYGGRDRALKGAAARLAQNLQDLGIEHDVKEYPNAGHSFMNRDVSGPLPLRSVIKAMGIRPDPVAAFDAWERLEVFLTRHLA